jgi:hypothetical protein
MSDQPNIDVVDPFADVVPIWAWAAKLRAAGMSTPVAQYAVSRMILSDLATSLQMTEPGQDAAWDAATHLVADRDGQDLANETNRGLANATQAIELRLLHHLDAQVRRVVRGQDDDDRPPTSTGDFEAMTFWVNGKHPVPLDVGAAPPEGLKALTLAATAKRTRYRQRDLVRLWEGMFGDDGNEQEGGQS